MQRTHGVRKHPPTLSGCKRILKHRPSPGELQPVPVSHVTQDIVEAVRAYADANYIQLLPDVMARMQPRTGARCSPAYYR